MKKIHRHFKLPFIKLAGTIILAYLSRYLRAVRLPPQNSAGAKKLGGSRAARKRPIGSTNNQWGINKTPTD
ncbi:hypothetical protein EXW62_16200 [Bacillus mycoides]|nr:hypothetical protein EXW62_16200 [Bacillus mycoides]